MFQPNPGTLHLQVLMPKLLQANTPKENDFTLFVTGEKTISQYNKDTKSLSAKEISFPALYPAFFMASKIISLTIGSSIGKPEYIEGVCGCFYIIYFPISTENLKFDTKIQRSLEESFPRDLFGEGTQTFVSYGGTNVQLTVAKK